ncbi:hypothetical protein Droror1_Dr00010538 [Drosera rotundifolia]
MMARQGHAIVGYLSWSLAFVVHFLFSGWEDGGDRVSLDEQRRSLRCYMKRIHKEYEKALFHPVKKRMCHGIAFQCNEAFNSVVSGFLQCLERHIFIRAATKLIS